MDYCETISMSCPKCKTEKLVERFSPKYQKPLVGCTNYPACTFFTCDLDVLRNPKRCKACGGFMTLRKGPHGLLYGCNGDLVIQISTRLKSPFPAGIPSGISHNPGLQSPSRCPRRGQATIRNRYIPYQPPRHRTVLSENGDSSGIPRPGYSSRPH